MKDDCLECPFHNWKFDATGVLKEVPYLHAGDKLPSCKPLGTYAARDYNGMLCVYFHAEVLSRASE